MKVLVTGGSGLVGNALRKLEPDWLYPSSSELNLMDNNQVIEYIDRERPHMVVHLAAKVGGLYRNMNDNSGMLVDNLRMNTNIIVASEQAGVKVFVGILSTCIFPNEIWYPLEEKQIHLGPPHKSNEGYSYAKRLMETHLGLTNMMTTCLIPTNLYGPHDNFNIEQAHVIPALIHKCYKAKKYGHPFVVSGSGSALRQFMYSEDLARIIAYFINEHEPKERHESFICSPPEADEVSIGSVARKIARHMGYESHLEFDTTQPEGQHRKPASNKLLMRTMGEFKFSNFNEKLKETIDWFKAQQN